MFIALRDLRFARGRFALLGTVVALLTLMVVMLSGLTAGLGAAGVSALQRLPADHLAFQRPTGQSPTFTGSSLPAGAAAKAGAVPGVESARPLGTGAAKLAWAAGGERHGSRSESVSVFGAGPGSDLAPRPTADGRIQINRTFADDTGLRVGQRVALGGRTVTVDAIEDTGSFAHLPVVFTSLTTWQQVTRAQQPTVLALRLASPAAAARVDAAAGTRTLTLAKSYGAVDGYSAEQTSLNLMRGLLLIVSALVVGAYFTVWTVQRAHDLAVVRAMGASRGYLLRDALAQAVVVLVVGGAAGTAVAFGAGSLAARAAPYQVSAGTVLLPFALMTVVGLVGSMVTVRRVASVDPLTALGAAR
ncbi:hypothetical protein BIV57_18990 [Mangrovactinospora gilvigrisea]|uniref:ABC3 transporter permease C-terminal domain-containing protein n=1 Tax=Mangrovactinospora gilvigrisea TaxID=1428644 RepID=A0A1J7C8F4_9ACTN|nr:ABC transporter permease [Mangrovactinospora gilvigrisea]OIV35922.1 hypothetical protein BIV57_18990 [Mangrovactinospora gilvigrisea]